jgi:hypothetical protein
MDKFSGISRAELVRELKEERELLVKCVAVCAAVVRSHFEACLRDVEAFLAYLLKPVTKAAQTATNRKRCSFHKEIRRVFAIARDKGLNVKDESGMRAAFSRALGRPIETREELAAGDWRAVGDWLQRGTLAW